MIRRSPFSARRDAVMRHLGCRAVPRTALWALASLLCAAPLALAGDAPGSLKDPYRDAYRGYKPGFVAQVWETRVFGRWRASDKEMRLSTEPSFFTLNMIHEDSRANALVTAALEKEAQSRYDDARAMYQIVIDKYPQALYRVSRYGVFVPISQYCQRRLLNFPAARLEAYRTLYDPRAREAFERARRKHSLIGLSEIVDGMLATSYGGEAIVELGNASLDTGHFLAALERFNTVREFFPYPELRTPELSLKIHYCERTLGRSPARFRPPKQASRLSSAQLAGLRRSVAAARYDKPPFHSQMASAPHRASDDHTLFPPSTDPLAVRNPVWEHRLPGSRHDFFVYAQPVVTENSVIYRHKNIVYCRSILTGEPRWINDLGGRATWQNWHERQYPQEDVLVQDGLVFTTVSKGGPSLVALDEVTGQLRWAYGPMVASTREEARLRFESAPAGGPTTVYAGYVLDNIEGDTHTDSEYGLVAFESATGRLRWRRPLSRLAPGKFAAGFAEQRRNRIRSFTSPPLYHQGTVYYNTNAGAVAALDSLSGRVKWLMHYPYHPGVHDATRQFGSGGGRVKYSAVFFRPHNPMFWYNQRPLVVGEHLYTLPVDSPFLLCLDRGTGKVVWSKPKGTVGSAHLLGPIRSGELVLVYTGRNKRIRAQDTPRPVQLIDPQTGQTVWGSDDLVPRDPQPVMKYRAHVRRGVDFGMGANDWWHEVAARPLITRDGRLHVVSFFYLGYPIFGWCINLGVVDLPGRKIVAQRRYYSGELVAAAGRLISSVCPREVAALEELPHKDARVRSFIRVGKEIMADSVPENREAPFLPFSRVTFRRYGVPFELRFGCRSVSMVYERAAVQQALAGRTDPESDFARAELALAASQLDDASARLKECLRRVSSEDLDFRALIRQQLFRVRKRLARSAIRAGQRDLELEHGLGMSRTASTLAEEIETLFALADAYERRGETGAAARALRSVIAAYGHHEYPVAPVAVREPAPVLAAADQVVAKAGSFAENPFYSEEMQRSLALSRRGLPLYFSAVSPLPKPLTVRAGELAAARLVRLRDRSAAFAAEFETLAGRELAGRAAEEQLYRLWEFPGTAAAQKVLDDLFRRAAALEGAAGRQRRWRLADTARICRLRVPEAQRARVTAPPDVVHTVAIDPAAPVRRRNLAEAEGINWLVLERRGDRSRHANLLFLGGRVRKRLDNKFVLRWFDLATGDRVWEQTNLRLRGKGQEPGFFEAFVHGDIVVFHGLYDVLAYDLRGKESVLRWRYRVPFDFETKHALLSGDLLILSGKSETVALVVPTASPAGEVAWQVKERGDLYTAPYFHGDRLVCVRKMPFNVTVRYRATGKLIGRLDLPDLSMHTLHPLLEQAGPRALPIAHDGKHLVVTDGWYYILLDIERMATVWKRLIDSNDLTREPAMRLALKGDYLAVLKEDYDQKVIYMLSSRTGEVLWHTDPKRARSPQPMHSLLIEGDHVYGIGVHPGQGFFLVGRHCETGQRLFRTEQTGYQSRVAVRMAPRSYGGHVVVTVRDRQDFELKAFDLRTGRHLRTLKAKGVAPFGVHGRVSATAQNGRLVLLSKDKLSF